MGQKVYHHHRWPNTRVLVLVIGGVESVHPRDVYLTPFSDPIWMLESREFDLI